MRITGKEYSLYLHIPFCSRKCPYCHFYVAPDRQENHLQLLNALQLEWRTWQPQTVQHKLASIYFGGGTPALVSPSFIQTLLSCLPVTEEITIEANPGEVSFQKLVSYRNAGINRLSLGVQSLHDDTLRILGRNHSAQQALDAVYSAKAAGFDNISIDLMYDVPQQTLTSWQITLDTIAQLPITHLSLYNLTIEPNTPFFRKKKALVPTLPPPEQSLQMLQTALTTFASQGFHRYELSAFCKNGLFSKHNIGYWLGRPFLGLGPSAFSFWNGSRRRNICNLQHYVKQLEQGLSPIDFSETLLKQALEHELFAIGLRIIEGVDLHQFSIDPATYQQLIDKNMLTIEGNRAKLTDLGTLFYDSVAEDLVLI